MRLRRSLLGIVCGVVLVLGATVQPASAKSISQVPATCSAGTAGYGIFLQQGSVVTLGFGASGLSSAGRWHVLIAEAGAPPIIDYTALMGQNWTVSTNRTMPAAFHVVAVNVENLDTGEICTSGMSFLVSGGGGGGGTTVALPDVQISGSPSTGTPAAGAQFSYTYEIKNSGQATATAVTFTDVLPAELDPLGFKSVTVSDGSACTAPVLPDSNQVLISCALGDMAPGAQKTVTVVVTAPPTSGTIVVNTATAYQTNGDSNWGNGDRKISVTVR